MNIAIYLLILSSLASFLIQPTVLFGFHLPDMGFLAWFYLIPLVFYVEPRFYIQSWRKKFILILLWTIAGHFGLLYWLVYAMKQFGGLSYSLAFLTLTALVVVMSLVFTCCMMGVVYLRDKTSLPYWLLLPVFLTLRDVILNYFPFGGYPWGIPPYSQGQWLSYFQWIDVTGVFGLSVFIYLINGLLCDGLFIYKRHKNFQEALPFISGAFVALFLSWGLSHISSYHYLKTRTELPPVKIATIQANIDQDIKWDRARARKILIKHIQLTQRSVANKADIIFWPETAYVYGFPDEDWFGLPFLTHYKFNTDLFFGTLVYNFKDGPNRQFNSVLQASTDGTIMDRYDKIHLVPFGEYIPFESMFPFMESLAQGIGFFQAGSTYKLMKAKGIQFGTIICIEDVFPLYARTFTQMGADVLVNYTNDAWYGDTSAQHQHLVYSQMRALENHRPVIRVTNSGVTAMIDATGNIQNHIPTFRSSVMMGTLPAYKGQAIFTTMGSKWTLVLFAAAIILLISAKKQARIKAKSQ